MAVRRSSLAAPFKAALEAVSAALDDVGGGMVIGGIAVIARGVARTTRDVDATVALDGDLETLVRLLARHDPAVSTWWELGDTLARGTSIAVTRDGSPITTGASGGGIRRPTN